MDDEPAVIHVTKRMLEMGGYVVSAATNAADALRLFENESWDLIITDRSMPQMDGEAMAARIRELAPQIPIVIITGFPESVEFPHRYAAVVRKPFGSKEILELVAQRLKGTP